MKVQMRNNLVGVVVPEKAKNNGVFVAPDEVFSTGIIKYIGPEASHDLKVGDKVSFGSKIQNITIGAEKLKVMEDQNIVAILGDTSETEVTKEKTASIA